ncbi:MAG: cytidine deaminase [Clostridiaceae bacterium]
MRASFWSGPDAISQRFAAVNSDTSFSTSERIDFMEIKIQELIDLALAKKEKAYVPYSQFSVGSAVQTESGELVGGFNIENASYGATNCAERTAIFCALQGGAKKIKALAVTGDPENYTYPCGICRQVMAEFGDPDMVVIVAKNRSEYHLHTLGEILPGAFTKQDLEGREDHV